MKTRNSYLQIYLLPLAKTYGTNQRKTKGGTLGIKKYFFQKNSQINSRIGLKIWQKYFENKNMFKNLLLHVLQCSYNPKKLCWGSKMTIFILFNPTSVASGVDTKSYQGLDRHFWSLNDQSDHFLIGSDRKTKPLSGWPRK